MAGKGLGNFTEDYPSNDVRGFDVGLLGKEFWKMSNEGNEWRTEKDEV